MYFTIIWANCTHLGVIPNVQGENSALYAITAWTIWDKHSIWIFVGSRKQEMKIPLTMGGFCFSIG